MAQFIHRKKIITSWNEKLEAIKEKIEQETISLFSDITDELLKTKFMSVRFDGREKEYLFCSSVTHEQSRTSWKINGVKITASGEIVCGEIPVEEISNATSYDSISPEDFFMKLKRINKSLHGNPSDVAKECLLYEKNVSYEHLLDDSKKIVAYCRLSHGGSKHGYERQIKLIDMYCKNKYIVDEWFNETVSGSVAFKDREAINKLLRHCRINDIKTIVISELNRLGRTENAIMNGISFLRKNGIEEIHSISENIVINKAYIESRYRELKGFAKKCEEDRDNISYRLSSGRKAYLERIKNGEIESRIGRPEGYRKSLDKYREEYQEVIDLLDKGVSYRNIHTITGRSVSTVKRVANLFCPLRTKRKTENNQKPCQVCLATNSL